MNESILDISVETLEGESYELSKYKDKALLIVNTASRCGFTPQYAGLQKLHEQYADRGLIVLGFPCNQFGQQEPGSNESIGSFCERNYGVGFQMHAKVDVNGSNAHPLFKFIKEKASGILGSTSIKWNFTKFLISPDASIITRYAPNAEPASMAADIETLLKD